MQNDVSMKDALLGKSVYPQAIGNKGVSMVDARDIAEAVALCLLARENAAEPLPRETIELIGPDALTGEAIAGIWSEALGRQIRCGGDDLAAFEKPFRNLRAALDGARLAADVRPFPAGGNGGPA